MSYIKADNIVVDFPVYGSKSRSLKNTLMRAATGGRIATDSADRVVVRAVDGVSFEIHEGDRVGLMGHNGSGKTTLLRTLAGIYEPVGGDIFVKGRVASMLSLTLGMDIEATGYDNIYLRGISMWLGKREIGDIVEEVCDFAELGDYIDMPMRTYSSGMAMRLAFAFSTSVKADIILMDEWLSVGDEAFAAKSKKRLNELVGQAKILVLASHSADVIRENCSRVIRLEHGRIVE